MNKNDTSTYDIAVIGAGSGGLTAAVGFAKIGKKVLLVEREHMGGECTNSGCIPSKALLHHAKSYYAAKTIASSSPELDAYRRRALAYVQAKIEEVRNDESPERVASLGVTVVLGEAIFEHPCIFRVGDQRYKFKTAIIATGSSPRIVEIPGLAQGDLLTNQNIFQLSEIPERLLIVGAGPIGMEMGQAFAMLGSAVTIVARESRFAALEDEEVSEIAQRAFERLGVRIILNARIKNIDSRTAVIETGATGGPTETTRVPYDKLLMAVGRVPNIPQGLDKAGIAYDEHAILIDSQFRTSNKDVYAIGDVAQRLKFTHTADDAARQVIARIASKKLLRVNPEKAVPKVTYTEPEIAAVGLNAASACKKYDCDEIFRIAVPYSANDRARTDDATDGLLLLTVRRLSGIVLGANIIGPAAGELIALFTLAIDRKISMWKLRSIIYAYPTYALLVKKAGDMFLAETARNWRSDVRLLVFRNMPKLAALFFWGIFLYGFYEYRMMHGMSLKEMLVMLYDIVTTSVWGPVIYMLAYAIRPLIFFPATLLTALSGALFGLPLGILFTMIGENASANFAYWIGRFFGKGLRLEDSVIGNWVEALRKRPFISVLFLRLFYAPFDLTNYGSGVLRVRWSSYALATMIGIMPGLTTFVALGAGIKDIRSFELSAQSFNFTSLGIAVTVFAVSLALSRALRRWHTGRSGAGSD